MIRTSFLQKILLIFFGIFLTLIILEVSLRACGFFLLSKEELSSQKTDNKNVYRVLCVGESTTMLGGKDSYPRQLETLLNEKTGKRFQVINKGLPGTNSCNILLNINAYLEKYNPGAVIIMMGINDNENTEEFKERGGRKRIIDLKNLRVVKLFNLSKAHLAKRLEDIDNLNEINYLIEINMMPKKQWAYDELAKIYLSQNNFVKAQKLYKKAVKISPKKSWGYKGLGECLEKQGKISDARQLYETAIKKNPNKRFGYEYLYNLYKSQQRNGDIELVLLDALKIYPDEYDLLTLLGEYYSDVKDFSQAKAVLKKAVEINPDNLTAYELLGFVYGLEGNYGEMELVFEGALNKGQHVALDLVNWYIQRNDFERAEAFLNKLLQEKGPDELILRGLANVCERASNNNKADEIYLQIENLKHNIYGKNTKNNYNKLVRIIQSYGARVICMQYPLRGIEPLKRMLEENENILFIDNEKNFKGSLRQGRYEDFFEDSFAGDFGHCTALGNRLIAQNAARVIVEKVFSKN